MMIVQQQMRQAPVTFSHCNHFFFQDTGTQRTELIPDDQMICFLLRIWTSAYSFTDDPSLP